MKRHRSVIQSERGGTSIAIALIMAMVVVVALVQNIFIWGQTLTAEESDRLHEDVSIQQLTLNNSSELVIHVRNTGSVDTHLVAIWVEPVATKNETQRISIDEYLSIEEIKEIVLNKSTLNASSLTEVHTFTVVTERGNSATYDYPPETSESFPELNYLGVFGIDWFYCRYSSVQNPPNGTLLTDAVYIMKSEDYVAFYMNVTNNYDRPCAFRADSFLTLSTIAPPQGAGEPNFYLVQNLTYNGTPTITPYSDSTPFIVFPNQSQLLIFASIARADNEWRWSNGYPFGPDTTTDGSDIQISLFYEIFENDELIPTGKYYGQTISTHAVTLAAK